MKKDTKPDILQLMEFVLGDGTDYISKPNMVLTDFNLCSVIIIRHYHIVLSYVQIKVTEIDHNFFPFNQTSTFKI